MGLRDEIKARTVPLICPVIRVAEELGEDGPEFLELAADRAVSSYALHEIVVKRGVKISRESIAVHRNGRCRCAS